MTHLHRATDVAARKRLLQDRARLLINIADERKRRNTDATRIQQWLTEIQFIDAQLNPQPGE